METITFSNSELPENLFAKASSASQDSGVFFDKLGIDSEVSDCLEDSLTKETNTPKEFNRFEENTVPSIGLLDKKIKKLHTREKKNVREDRQKGLASVRDKRSIKKPVHEYETTRVKEEERLKNRRTKKKEQVIKEKVVKTLKTENIPSSSKRVDYCEKPEDSYKWRDWSLYFNQELAKLGMQEFFEFFSVISNKHPECVSFAKGYGELKVAMLQDEERLEQERQGDVSSLVGQNVTFELFCGYIEEIKKMRGKQ